MLFQCIFPISTTIMLPCEHNPFAPLRRTPHGVMASQIIANTTVCSSISLGTHQRKHQNFTLLALCDGNRRWTVDAPTHYPRKSHVMRIIFTCHDVIIIIIFIWTGMEIKVEHALIENFLLTVYYSFIYLYMTYHNHICGCTVVSDLNMILLIQKKTYVHLQYGAAILV